MNKDDVDCCLVSILIPCFNAERWIHQAVASALAQTYSPIEVIVLDDGSTDGSLGVIESFGDQIRWQAEPHRGGNAARNRLLNMASGDWVQFLDGDDELLPDKVSSQLQCLRSSQRTADAIYGPAILQYHSGDAVASQIVSRLDEGGEPVDHWLTWQLGQTGVMLWNREAILRLGGWNELQPCCQDNEICMRAIHGGFRFLYCDKPGAIYRLWDSGTVSRRDPRRVIDEKLRLLARMQFWMSETGVWSNKRKHTLAKVHFDLCRTLAQIDADAAAFLARKMQDQGLWQPSEKVSATYRFFCCFFGFQSTERMASFARKVRSFLLKGVLRE